MYCWISHTVFRRFTEKVKIVKRCAKVGQPSHDSFIDVHTSRKRVDNVKCSSCSKTSEQPKRRNINVLPEQCIICKENKYTNNSYSRKRRREKLSVFEYTSGELEVN